MNRQIQSPIDRADVFTDHRGLIETSNAIVGISIFGTFLHGFVCRVSSLAGLLILVMATSGIYAVTIRISDADFANSPVFSDVVTYDIEIDLAVPLQPGLVSDPSINNIQYSVSGNLADGTVSGFDSFAFRLDHKFSSSPPITGTEFYALNSSSVAGGTLQYSVSASADLSDGLQVSELDELPVDATAGIGPGVVFHFNGREKGTGRYHPLFLQLFSDGTGILQNADNKDGINPATEEVVDVDFGDEYITELNFAASSLTIVGLAPSIIPAPSIQKSDQANSFDIVYSSEPGFFYQLQQSIDLRYWTDNGLPVSGSSSQDLRFSVDQTGFFRIARTVDFIFSE